MTGRSRLGCRTRTGGNPAGRLPAAFWILFLENFAFNAAHNVLSLLVPALAGLGAGRTLLGLIGTLNTLVLLLVLVGLPGLAVRLPRLPALAAGFALLVAGDLLACLQPASLGWLVLWRLPGTLSYVLSMSLLMAMVYDLAPAAAATGTIAVFGISGLLSNPVASLLGERALAGLGTPGPLLVSAGFGLLALVGLAVLARLHPAASPARLTPPAQPAGSTGPGRNAVSGRPQPGTAKAAGRFFLGLPRELLGQPRLRHLGLLALVFGAAFPAWMTFLPLLGRQVPGGAWLSWFTLPFALASVLVRLGFSRRLDTADPGRLLRLAFLAMALAFGLMVLPPQPVLLVLAGLLYGLAHSVLFPLLSALQVKAGGADRKAAWNNAFIVETSLGALVLVPLAGLAGDLWGPGMLFAALAGLSLAAALGLAPRIAPAAGQAATGPG